MKLNYVEKPAPTSPHFVSISLVSVVAAAFLSHRATAATVDLGTASSFAVLAGSTITNTGPTVVDGGNVGVSPGAAITGFPPGIVTPPFTTHAGDPVAVQAQNDLTTAHNAVAGLAPTQDLSGQNLGGLTLGPGVYFFATTAQLTGTLTLNYGSDPNAQFVFQIGSTLTTASNSSVTSQFGTLVVCNVFWQVGSSATLGTDSDFAGNMLALTSITLNAGATVNGRALARNGAVTMDSNAVSVSDCPPVPEPGVTLLLGSGLAILFAIRRRPPSPCSKQPGDVPCHPLPNGHFAPAACPGNSGGTNPGSLPDSI